MSLPNQHHEHLTYSLYFSFSFNTLPKDRLKKQCNIRGPGQWVGESRVGYVVIKRVNLRNSRGTRF